jgi:hypothetical protein
MFVHGITKHGQLDESICRRVSLSMQFKKHAPPARVPDIFRGNCGTRIDRYASARLKRRSAAAGCREQHLDQAQARRGLTIAAMQSSRSTTVPSSRKDAKVFHATTRPQTPTPARNERSESKHPLLRSPDSTPARSKSQILDISRGNWFAAATLLSTGWRSSIASALLTKFHGRDVTSDSLIVAPALLGDANLDDLVDFDDLVTLADHFDTTGGTWAVGDFNADSLVDSLDLALVESQYGGTPAEFDVAWALARGITPLFGDYNSNGVVDAADYTVWRDSLGQAAGSLANDPNFGVPIGEAQYNTWRTNFGATLAGSPDPLAVPEPCALLLIACAASAMRRRAGR